MIRILSLLIILIAFSCSNPTEPKKNGSSASKLKCYPMEKLFFDANESKDYRSYYNTLFKLDSNLTIALFGNCYQVIPKSDTALNNQMLRRFPEEWTKEGKEIQMEIQKSIPRQKIENQLTSAFEKLRSDFPSKPIPTQLIFLYSDFGIFTFSTDKSLSIGLENFIGDQSPVIKKINIHPWLKKKMKSEFLCPRAIHNWLNTHYLPTSEKNLASEMIRWGKILYLTENLLPDTPIGNILAQSDADMVWMVLNEKVIWNYVIDQKLLYDSKEETIKNLIDDAPFSLGKYGIPDRTGQFLGYQMVREFMQKNSLTFPALLDTPYLKIIQQYTPPK